MSDASATGAGFGDFGKWVPGFEFLQSLTRSAGPAAAAPASWVAPTLSVEELDKRIQELKTVQFWLEQNGTALKATIQALEVQKMTLSALRGMNVSLQDMAQAFSAKAPAAPPASPAAPIWPSSAQGSAGASGEAGGSGAPAQAAQADPAHAGAGERAGSPKPSARAQTSKSRSKAAAAGQAASQGQASVGMVDPMQWWGALTQQFQQIASAAMADAQARVADAPAAAKAAAGTPRAAPSRASGVPRKSKPKASR